MKALLHYFIEYFKKCWGIDICNSAWQMKTLKFRERRSLAKNHILISRAGSGIQMFDSKGSPLI